MRQITPKLIDSITIYVGLRDEHRSGTAWLFFDAFGRKLTPLLGSGENAVEAIAFDLDAERSIVAVSENNDVVGIAGLSYGGRRFANFRRQTFTRRFGPVMGILRYAAYAMFNLPDIPGEIIVDGLAVDKAWRRRGIGAKLLEEVFEYARRNGKSIVKLVVADNNPDARRLYERLGFTVTNIRKYPKWMARRAGFSREITMVKKIEL